MNMTRIAQDHYPDEVAVCYGCGKNNPHGYRIQTQWDGEEGFFRFTPEPYHLAFPGVVYGGLLASLVDCMCTGTAMAAAYDQEPPDSDRELAYVTANLNVNYLKPTPMGVDLELKSKVKEMKGKKAIVTCSIFADGVETVRGEVLAIQIASRRPDSA